MGCKCILHCNYRNYNYDYIGADIRLLFGTALEAIQVRFCAAPVLIGVRADVHYNESH